MIRTNALDPASGVRRTFDTNDFLRRLGETLRTLPNDEHDLLERFFALFRRLLPGAVWTVRIIDERGVRLVRSTQRPIDPERFVLSATALADIGLPRDFTWPHLETYEAEGGMDAALFNGEQLVGSLSCSVYCEEAKPWLCQLAMHLGPLIGRAHGRFGAREQLVRLLSASTLPLWLVDDHGTIEAASPGANALYGANAKGNRFATLFAEATPLQTGESTRCNMKVEQGALPLALHRLTLEPMGERGALFLGQDLRPVLSLENQVIQSEKLATLGQLAAGVVHELNNPLTSIAVYAEQLRAVAAANGSDDERALSCIAESAERIRRFTQSLLTYARPACSPPVPVPIDLVIDEALGFCEHLLREADARVRVLVDTPSPNVLGVRAALHQVFINLVTNACHAMTSGNGELLIRASIEDDKVMISVEDNGAGISTDQLEAVFEPFFSTKGEGEGTGLGLSIVRNILVQQGGTIHAESEPGKGARFIVRLRRACPADD